MDIRESGSAKCDMAAKADSIDNFWNDLWRQLP